MLQPWNSTCEAPAAWSQGVQLVTDGDGERAAMSKENTGAKSKRTRSRHCDVKNSHKEWHKGCALQREHAAELQELTGGVLRE